MSQQRWHCLFGSGLFTKYPLNRRAERFIGAVDAAYPAARPPYSFFELGNHTFHMIIPRLLLPNCNRPTNPLIAGEGC